MHILPADYVHHLCLLVASIHIFLGSEISSSDLSRAEHMLQIFYKAIPKLYPEESLTCNVHSLIHLVECVRQYGPLWTFSCFGFDNMNGYLKKHCHGTRNVLPQLARILRMQQIFLSRHSSEGDGVRGRVKHKELSIDHGKALDDYSGDCIATNVLPVFQQYKLGTVVYRAWNKHHVRNSSVCKFRNSSGTIHYGCIHCFCFWGGEPVAVLAVFTPKDNALEEVQNSSIPELNLLSILLLSKL